MVNYTLSDNIAKIMVTEDRTTGMVVVFWNGNDDIDDWDDPGSYPDTYDLMRNMMDFICQSSQPPPDAIPVLNSLGVVLLVLLMAGVGVFFAMRE